MKLLLLAAGIASAVAAIDRGDLDEAARQGALAGPAAVESALRSRVRSEQLVGIVAAPSVADREELLGTLADVAGGPDRRTALPAARAATRIALALADRSLPDDLAAEDLAMPRARWEQLAHDVERPIAIRVHALDVCAALARAAGSRELGFDASLLADPDPALRVIAVGLVPQPVPASLRDPIAKLATSDPDLAVKREAARVLR